MGQQLKKYVKRRRRKAYLERKKALANQGISRKVVSRAAKSAEGEDKPAAKKAAVKKKAVKKTAKPAEGETPEVEGTQAEESAE